MSRLGMSIWPLEMFLNLEIDEMKKSVAAFLMLSAFGALVADSRAA